MFVINHCIYLIARTICNVHQSVLETIAYAKRLTERMFAKILITTVRLTNLNPLLGFELSQNDVWSSRNYVVLRVQKRLKQVATKCGLMEERPKVRNKHRLTKLGILHYPKGCGERKNRSTTVIICRKGSSLAQSLGSKFLEFYDRRHLFKLNPDLRNGLKAIQENILSLILANNYSSLFNEWI